MKSKSVTSKTKKSTNPDLTQSVVARSDDGSIQITFTIPWIEVENGRNNALAELGRDIEVPGFRKGMAPQTKVAEKIPPQKLIEKTLSGILPKMLGNVISENKLKIAIYPKFELISAKEGENWQVRAVTCEIPQINLNNYKELIRSTFTGDKIWTPGKTPEDPDKKPSDIEKEQKILDLLIKSVEVKIPKVLLDEEVNVRLSQLLEKIEKLGITLDTYLASIAKTPESLRSEYEEQSKNAISLELILNKISEEEGIKVDEKEIDSAISAGGANEDLQKKLNTPEQRSIIDNVLRRRKALDFLLSLT